MPAIKNSIAGMYHLREEPKKATYNAIPAAKLSQINPDANSGSISEREENEIARPIKIIIGIPATIAKVGVEYLRMNVLSVSCISSFFPLFLFFMIYTAALPLRFEL